MALFDALWSALMEPHNRDRFLRIEGLQLMILIIKATIPLFRDIILN